MTDVTDHPSLFELTADAPDQAGSTAPRCRMCRRPARWNRVQSQWAMYCSGATCSNRERTCQASGCGRTFIMNVDGAGTKYCSTECKKVGYGVAWAPAARPFCAWCGVRAPSRASAPGRIWPYVCSGCIHPIRHLTHRLKSHRVPHEMARRLLDAPGCEVCGRDIVSKARDSEGRFRSLLTVDHDHQCCPGARSCGLCVRGFLCPSATPQRGC
jgi:hypothetical protein